MADSLVLRRTAMNLTTRRGAVLHVTPELGNRVTCYSGKCGAHNHHRSTLFYDLRRYRQWLIGNITPAE